MKDYTFKTALSEIDQEYVGTCDEFPSLSWLAKTEKDALSGIKMIVSSTLKDIMSKTFKILNNNAVIFEGNVEVFVPNDDIGSKVIAKLSNALLDEKIKSLRLVYPKKVIFITAHDKEHIKMYAEDVSKIN